MNKKIFIAGLNFKELLSIKKYVNAKSDRFNISMLLMLKLIPIHLYNSLYSMVLFK